MHPAKSVILFTTASGAGYGLMIMFALMDLQHALSVDQSVTLLGLGVGNLLVITGLMSSTFHLGHPERAWRALTQWRSSWLSREGVMAIVTFGPSFAYLGLRYIDPTHDMIPVLAVLLILCGLVTVFCTAMIYACLRTVPAWFTGWTPANYLLLSLATGMVLMNGISLIQGVHAPLVALVTAMLLCLGLTVKLLYWHSAANGDATSSAESATGLGKHGRVRMLDPPHDGSNYLMQEMGFAIARKHAGRLRRFVILWGFCLPIIAILIGGFGAGTAAMIAGLLSIPLVASGIAVERWLFFAEAKHVVSLYYGQSKI